MKGFRRVQRSRASALDWLLLLGSENNSLIGHLDNYFLGSREEKNKATPVISKKILVIQISQIGETLGFFF